MPRKAASAASDPLATYRAKRDFALTPEPHGEPAPAQAPAAAPAKALSFVVQKHDATRLHYDFRLECDGVMWSWAVPKGPSYDPADKRMAVQTEDHPISYNTFEGVIPKGQYGAGRVIVWDRGIWEPAGDPRQGLAEGKLPFTLHGSKLAGQWELIRIKKKEGEKQQPWILFKKRDAWARPRAEYDVVTALPDSVVAKPLPPPEPPATDAGRLRRDGALAKLPQRAAQCTGAVERPLPATLTPQLATAAKSLPAEGDWVFEIKLDGYRIMARCDGDDVRLITRGGHDWTTKMPAIAADLRRLGAGAAWLDGEVVVLGPDGTPSFNALQNAFDRRHSDEIVYFVFDAPHLQGYDLRAAPLRERRAVLRALLESAPQLARVRWSESFDADPSNILQSAARLHLEGLMAKRCDAPYVSRRTETWLKLKTHLRQEFVVAGFTDRGGDAKAAEIGSLLLGVHDAEGRLIPAGSVGTGWSAAAAAELKSRLVPLETKTAPYAKGAAGGRSRWSRRNAGHERWVRPELVAEVSFSEWTPDAQVRHAKFEGLRADKPARQVVREEAVRMDGIHARAKGAAPARGKAAQSAATTTRSQIKVTHPERVIDATTGLTKLDLVRYYESVADWMAPHLKGRPCSLVRGPEGVGGQLFYQKHLENTRVAGIVELPADLWPEHPPLIEVPTPLAIASAAQLNVIEFHTWNAHVRHIDKPDRVVFDLDPGSGVAWARMLEAATLTRGFLEELGLRAWLKTSGGKGLHVVVPLAARWETEAVKAFARAVVEHLAKVLPDRFVAKSGSANRVGKIFVDYLRNNFGATTAAAYSARARPGLGVSMPLPWHELETLKSGAQWTIANAREHLSFVAEDPWAEYWQTKQTLTKAAKKLGIS